MLFLIFRSFFFKLTNNAVAARFVRVDPVVHLAVKFERFEYRPVVDQFLRNHPGGTDHGQSTVLQFSGLHVSERFRVFRLEIQRIESHVSGIVRITQFPQSRRPRIEVRFDPTDLGPTQFRGRDEGGQKRERRQRHLL